MRGPSVGHGRELREGGRLVRRFFFLSMYTDTRPWSAGSSSSRSIVDVAMPSYHDVELGRLG